MCICHLLYRTIQLYIMDKELSPTQEFYSLLETAYDVFNKRLFDGKLSNCLLTVQREKKTMGYFSKDRWVNQAGDKTHEIALNPAYFGNHKVVEIFQTLVHEQCHLWQSDHGKPSRRTYHNVEWADKMQSIGLMPSTTGYEGGKRIGQKMSDYPIPGGLFLEVCTDLIAQGITITWFDRFASETKPSQTRENNLQAIEPVGTTSNESSQQSVELEVLFTQVSELVQNDSSFDDDEPIFQVAAKTTSKIKYCCPSCATNIWGKPKLSVICGSCNLPFEANE